MGYDNETICKSRFQKLTLFFRMTWKANIWWPYGTSDKNQTPPTMITLNSVLKKIIREKTVLLIIS